MTMFQQFYKDIDELHVLVEKLPPPPSVRRRNFAIALNVSIERFVSVLNDATEAMASWATAFGRMNKLRGKSLRNPLTSR